MPFADLTKGEQFRLYVKGQCVSQSCTFKYAKLALKVNGYKGKDWVIWLGTMVRPMTRLIASGTYNEIIYTHKAEEDK